MVEVVVIFSPVDFKDLDHVSFEDGYYPFQRREYVSQQTCLPDGNMFLGPSSMEFLIDIPDRTVAAFIGSALLHETFKIKDNNRPNIKIGTEEWEMERWHWNAYQLSQDKDDQGDDQDVDHDDDKGPQLSRACMISDIPQVTYVHFVARKAAYANATVCTCDTSRARRVNSTSSARGRVGTGDASNPMILHVRTH